MIQEGDTVICVDASGHEQIPGIPPRLIKGRKYIVYGIMNLPCGCPVIDVGLVAESDYNRCVNHNERTKSNDNIHWCYSKRFRKIEPLYRTIEISMKKEEMILN